MARPQQSSTFVVPESIPSPLSLKDRRDAKPFVVVPASMVMADDKLEPHWLPAIEAATD
ncbi:MAG TPA: hypothetical protein VMT47_18760 [Polyangia bacterium]|nr:hypothetical protein [Polyangia bacterium]